MLAVRAVKFFLDGVIESHTAAMLENYSDGTNSTGPTAMPPDHTHAISDRAVRLALDAYENAAKVNGKRDSRHRIEHIESLVAA